MSTATATTSASLRLPAGPVEPATLAELLPLLAAYSSPEHWFGALPTGAGRDSALDEARARYRRLCKLAHPDREPDPRAPMAFARLTALWEQFQAVPSFSLTTKRDTYTFGCKRAVGDVSALYDGTSASGVSVTLKLSRVPIGAELLRREATALRAIRDHDAVRAPYFPALIDSAAAKGASGEALRLNVFEPLPTFVTLSDAASRFAAGLHPRDLAWMWRRALVALGAAHAAGYAHGAPFPEHLLIEPALHGLVLAGWGHSVLLGEPLTRVPGARVGMYPLDAKEEASPALDLYLFHASLAEVAAPMPRALLAFIKGCTLTAPRARPQDAWLLLKELDELLENLWGPRVFRPLVLPTARLRPS